MGLSNAFIDNPVARISYDTRAVAGWMQPVRYSPYPRNLEQDTERFGAEKDGHYAAEGEVHIHVGCPIPDRQYIKIRVLGPHVQRRQGVVERYGQAGIMG